MRNSLRTQRFFFGGNGDKSVGYFRGANGYPDHGPDVQEHGRGNLRAGDYDLRI